MSDEAHCLEKETKKKGKDKINDIISEAQKYLNPYCKIPFSSNNSAFRAYRQLRDYLEKEILLSEGSVKLKDLVNAYKSAKLEGNLKLNLNERQYTLEEIASLDEMVVAEKVADLEQNLFFTLNHSNRKLINYTIKSMKLNIDQYYDTAEGALRRAVKYYNPDREDGSGFSYFASQSIVKDVIRQAEKNIKMRIVSLNKKVGKSKREFVNFIPVYSSPLFNLEKLEIISQVRLALDRLPSREREVITIRYLEDDKIQTLDSVGKRMGGITRESVRQIECSAFKKLRRKLKNLY